MAKNTVDQDYAKPVHSPVNYKIPGKPVIITINRDTSPYPTYEIGEPDINKKHEKILEQLKIRLLTEFKNKNTKKKYLRNFSLEFSKTAQDLFPSLTKSDIETLEYYINRDSRDIGPIQPLMDDSFVLIISVTGPKNQVIIRHREEGTLSTSLTLGEEEISHLIKKIKNRSSSPDDSSELPTELILNSGYKVHLTYQENKALLPEVKIEKNEESELFLQNCEKENPVEHVVLSYYIYHDMIEARIVKSKDNTLSYKISFIPLTKEEEKAVGLAKERDVLISGLSTLDGRSIRITFGEFAGIMQQEFPAIPESRYRLLYSALSFEIDKVRWIRVLISDPNIERVICTHPDKPAEIRHAAYPRELPASVIPSRTELNRFAAFLFKSSGMPIIPEEDEFSIRYKTGERVTLLRIKDDLGHYFRVDFKKSQNSNQILKSDTNKPVKNKRRIQGRNPERISERINTILENVFSESDYNDIDSHNKESKEPIDTTKLKPLPEKNNGKKNKERFLNFTWFNSKKEPETSIVEYIPEPVEIPPLPDIQTEIGLIAEEAYWLNQPNAYAVIARDRNREKVYRIIEPELSQRDMIILEETHETLRDVLIYDKPVAKGGQFLTLDEVSKIIKMYDPNIPDDRLSVLYYYLVRNLNGYAKIDPLMYDELLEDISCNGHDLPVYVYHRYYGSMPTSVKFEADELTRFVLKLSQKADKQVSLTSPLLDAALPNGSRAQVTYSDVVSTKGSSFTIRKFRKDPMTPATLTSFGTFSPELLAFIWLSLENRQSLIVVGGTASGKTSTMNAISFFIPHHSKIVSLEDTREIQIPQKNWLPVQTRESNFANERGNIDLFDLLRASLRQRPEFIIVGEVRGVEAQTLFQAMNSGHTTLSTLHAGNIEEALNRLTNEPINVPAAMFGALNLMIIQTFHYRAGRMVRRCDAIHEIVLGSGDKINWNTLYEYDPQKDAYKRVFKKSKVLQTIQYMHNWSEEEIRYQLDLREQFLIRLKSQFNVSPERLIQMITDLRRKA